MPEWQERITKHTHPEIRVEHELRYRAAAPIVAGASAWLDLGCGTGVAAADALADRDLPRVVLADADADALEQAGRDLQAREVVRVAADLSTAEGLAQVREALAGARGAAITCFEVIEHLPQWAPVVEMVVELAEQAEATAVLSVPNDAFWALENPFHVTTWGEGAFEELRRLLPADALVARQIPLRGSCVVVEGTDPQPIVPPAAAARDDAVPSHFLAAFGPRARELDARALVAQTDLDGQRRWERERESQLAFHEAELADLREKMRAASDELARLKPASG